MKAPRLALLIFSLTLTGEAGAAQEKVAAFTGTVKDRAGHPIEGARVDAFLEPDPDEMDGIGWIAASTKQRERYGTPCATVITGEDGRYALEDLPASAAYAVRVKADGL